MKLAAHREAAAGLFLAPPPPSASGPDSLLPPPCAARTPGVAENALTSSRNCSTVLVLVAGSECRPGRDTGGTGGGAVGRRPAGTSTGSSLRLWRRARPRQDHEDRR